MAQGEVIEVGLREIDAPAILARTSGLACLWACVDVAQPGILAQPTDDLQLGGRADAVDEAGLGEVGVGGQVAAQCPAGAGLPDNGLGVVVSQADAFGLALSRAGRLHGVQVPGRVFVDVDDRQ